MLTTAQLFNTGMAGAGLELEIVQSAIRVLLSCVASDNKDVSHITSPHPHTTLTLGPLHFESTRVGSVTTPHTPHTSHTTHTLTPHTPHTPSQYFVAASLKLEHLMRVPTPTHDALFILSNLVRIMTEAIESGDDERSEYISSVVKNVFSQHYSRSGLTNELPGMPSPHTPSFSTEFIKYSETKEWLEYSNGVVSVCVCVCVCVWGCV